MRPEEYGKMRAAEESHWWYAGMREITARLLAGIDLPAPDAAEILDAGCGTGRNLLEWRALGTAVGIDLAPAALIDARDRGGSVILGTLERLPLPADRFDLVTCFDVLYHRWVEDDLCAVNELARVLRPGGWLLLRVPALMALWGAHDEAVLSRHRYRMPEIVQLLKTAGLELHRTTYANTLLLPVLFLHRALDRWTGREGSDVAPLPSWIDTGMLWTLRAEARLVEHVRLPIGSSLFAVARKPRAAA